MYTCARRGLPERAQKSSTSINDTGTNGARSVYIFLLSLLFHHHIPLSVRACAQLPEHGPEIFVQVWSRQDCSYHPECNQTRDID